MFSNEPRSLLLRQMRPKKRSTFITVIILGSIIFIFLLAYLAYGQEPTPEPSLIQINVLFRHGERTPGSFYPTDPHKDYPWPDGLGALTNKGKLGMFTLGENFGKRYRHLLGELFSPEEVSIKCSYAPRCQMSAMTFFAGLFPPVGPQVWNKDLNWQPILVNPIPRDLDNIIADKAFCKAYQIEKDKSDDELHASLSPADQEMFKYLSENTGEFISTIERVEFLYSTLKIEEENGLALPEWTKRVYPEQMRRMAALNLASYVRTPKLKRLQSGPLLREWLDNLNNGTKKAYFYSGHDITLVNFMRTLGFEEEGFLPDYGATFIIELHHLNGEKLVKSWYYNSSRSVSPINLKLPGCETDFCPLNKFTSLLSPLAPSNWASECNSQFLSSTAEL